MAKAKRVFELAKELGVKSKAIVDKCQAEGVPGITNHMSTVKLGLAETVRQWFSDAAAASDSTAVETAEKVDLEKAKAKAKARKKAKPLKTSVESKATAKKPVTVVKEAVVVQDESLAEAVVEAEVKVAEPVAETAAPAAPAPVVEEPKVEEPKEQIAAEVKVEDQPAVVEKKEEKKAEEEAPKRPEKPAVVTPEQIAGKAKAKPKVVKREDKGGDKGRGGKKKDFDKNRGKGNKGGHAPVVKKQPVPVVKGPRVVKPMGQVNVPDRPEIIKPVGQMMEKPKQVALKGPKVIRVEKPEPVVQRPPRGGNGGPRRGGGGQGGGGPRGGRGPMGGGGGGPRGPRGPMGGGGAGAPPMDMGAVEGISRSRGPARGRGAGAGAGGGQGGQGGGGGPQRGGPQRGGKGGGRRGMNQRRGRSGSAALPSGPSKFSQADMEELDARLKGASGFMKQRRRDMNKRGQQVAPTPAMVGGKVEIAEPITIKSLSAATGIKGADIMKYLFAKGIMATINSAIDTEAAMEVALEYDIELEVKEMETAEQMLVKQFEGREKVDVKGRPPVVTVLGHVDHGKTSLLDRIRKADVAAHEAGGITQHVGAYRVTIKGSDASDKTVVFLDTPGHEAFTSMRARGAGMTDMVVLVVAADDGCMPQTIESINHSKAAGVPVVVALNKCDTPQATPENIQKIYGQLAEHGLNPTEWGGETEIIKTSAITGEGVEDLIEILDYQAELLDLTADYGGPARGTVVEAEMQTGRGSVARVLLQEGQMKVGSYINIGRAFGRVRDMSDDKGKSLKSAGPATPLELSGIDILPDAGDKFYVTDSLQQAEQVAQQYRDAERMQMLAAQTKVTLDNFASAIKEGQKQDLRVVLKADVQGTLKVLRDSLEKLSNDEVQVKVLHSAVGGVTESDVVLADASDAIIIGFHVAITPAVREIAEARKVDVRLYRVLYELTDEVKQALEGMLAPEKKEEQVGVAEVKEAFKISKLGMVAGCIVEDGAMRKDCKARITRNGVVVTDERDIESIRRVKDEVKEVRAGTECGIRLVGFEDIKSGDRIECYRVIEVKRKLELG
ncbi:translation initiation factor IF-2 [Planctomycetota bacterium]|nr:translation initiation factor IF-2 [Planctomycetota bacterium]